MNKLIFLLLLISNVCIAADEAFLGYGLGVFKSASESSIQVKVIDGGIRSFLIDGIYWQIKGGYWIDSSSDPTRKSGGFASSGPGMEVNLAPVEIRSGWGLGFITTPDSILGGVFPQFNGELYIGLRDKKGDGIGLEYNHISSAGLVTPNQGRDFIILQLSQKW